MTREEKRVRFYYQPNPYRLGLVEEALREEEERRQSERQRADQADESGSGEPFRHQEPAGTKEGTPDPGVLKATDSADRAGGPTGKERRLWAEAAMLLIVATVAVGLFRPDVFANRWNLAGLLGRAGYCFILAAPLTCLLITGQTDLSVGAVICLGCGSASMVERMGFPFPMALGAALLAGAVCGGIKWILLEKLPLSSFVTTLCLQYGIMGLVYPIGTTQIMYTVPVGWLFAVILAAAEGILFHILLTKTGWGQKVYAAGSAGGKDAGASKVRLPLHVLISTAGAMCGAAGMVSGIIPFQSLTVNFKLTLLFSLALLSAIIIGGTWMTGEKGTIAGSAIGCLLIAVLDRGVFGQGEMTGPSAVAQMLFGAVVVGAVLLDRYRRCGEARKEGERTLLISGILAAVLLAGFLSGRGIAPGNESAAASGDRESTAAGDDRKGGSADERTLQSKQNILMTDHGIGCPTAYAFQTDIRKEDIRRICFTDSLELMPDEAWDVSEAGDGSVMAWMVWSEEEDVGDFFIGAEGKIQTNEDCSYLLGGYHYVEQIDFGDCFDTSRAVNMHGMFQDDWRLLSLDVSRFDTSNVEDMIWMFVECHHLARLELGEMDTSQVTDMTAMFAGCRELEELDVTSFDTSKVTSMKNMFGRCARLTELDVSGFTTTEVTDMSYMFKGCQSVESLDMEGFDTSNVTTMREMFAECGNLAIADFYVFDMSNVENDRDMFSGTIWEDTPPWGGDPEDDSDPEEETLQKTPAASYGFSRAQAPGDSPRETLTMVTNPCFHPYEYYQIWRSPGN